jgi:hypothetical protein
MRKKVRQTGVPALGHAGDVLNNILLFVVIVDIEMLGLEDLEVERVVSDLILSEILR